MPGSHWLNSGSGGTSYDSAPRPTGGPQVAKPPVIPAGVVPGTGTPSLPELKTKPDPMPKVPQVQAQTPPVTKPAEPNLLQNAAHPQQQPQPTTQPSTMDKAWDAGSTALNNQTGYEASKFLMQRAAPSLVPSTSTAATSLATRVPALYGAYALGDLAISPVRAAMGYDNYQDLQMRGVNDSYLSNVGSNLMRPGRALFGTLDSAYNGTVGGVREYFRGRSLDQQAAKARQSAPRPTQPWSGAGATTGGADF